MVFAVHVDPTTQTVPPVHPCPPHCPYLDTILATTDAEDTVEVISVVGGAMTVVVRLRGVTELIAASVDVTGDPASVLDEFDAEPPLPPQVATGPPGALYVVGLKPQ